ncbi:MAG: histidine phosphatase family protein [Anaerovoracaceae bacterium]|nr:histidine phosphatase family protein [Bacillota bacterium]MDY2670489.1 histidine phosphatase family protein [Anaerovoracaceae bacterium]
MDYGPYEGTSLEHPSPEIIHFFSDFVHNPAPEGMESLAHVTGRMGDFLEDLKETDAESVLLATHAIALKGALEYLTPESDGQWWSRFISTCAVFSTEYDGKEYSLPVEEFQIR